MMAIPVVATAVRPTETGERLHALDVLRGLALFGMILVHFHQKTRRDATGLEQDQWLCYTYIGAIVLVLAFRPTWTARLAVFGFAGRMALTNYLVQAAALDALSSGYGVDLKLRPYAYSVAAVLLFGAEAEASRAWLARYRFGPLEWLWRTVTYARVQPLRRAPAETGTVPVSWKL
jgi:uncharacterized membrane protein YeiB